MYIDEEQMLQGVNAVSIVENPAIQMDFVALSEEKQVMLAEVDGEKRILMGALLIPNKPIYRRNGEEEFYVYFSKDTVIKASQMYLLNGNQSESTLEHEEKLSGLTLVESWIVEDTEKDKSALYNLSVPTGTWMGTVKVDNDEIWNDYVKTGKVKGFSIEGYFADKIQDKKELSEDEKLLQDLIEILKQ